jgi:hypothetical protein
MSRLAGGASLSPKVRFNKNCYACGICTNSQNTVSLIWTALSWLNMLVIVWFQDQTNFQYCPSCLKNDARFKSGQKRPQNKHLPLLV